MRQADPGLPSRLRSNSFSIEKRRRFLRTIFDWISGMFWPFSSGILNARPQKHARLRDDYEVMDTFWTRRGYERLAQLHSAIKVYQVVG